MSLASDDVENIAHLARLALAETDIVRYTRELSAILELVEQMQRTDTDAVAPMAHPLDLSQRLRADQVTESDQRERLQANAPSAAAGFYLVPKVIE